MDYLAEDANLSQQILKLQYLEIPQMEIFDLNFGSFYVINDYACYFSLARDLGVEGTVCCGYKV